MESNYSSFSKNNKFDYHELIGPYKKHWKWFALSLFLSIALALIKIRYTTPEYAVQGKIQILEDQSTVSELGAFSDL